MKFCLHFANTLYPGPKDAKRLALAAEAAGFESIMATEHVIIPTHYESKYPYSESGRMGSTITSQRPDPLAWLTYIGALTNKLRLVTGVLVLPQRNPVVLAKHVATIDNLTGGRLELGIGVGWLREEFEALGIPFARRGARTNEYIEAMRTLWDNDDVSFDGEFVAFNGVSCNPKPTNGRVPIVVGGNSKAALRRAGKYGDGYFPATGDAALDITDIIQALHAEARDAGRDPSAIQIMTGCPDALPGSGKDALTAVAALAAAGVDRIVLPLAPFEADLEGLLAEFGERVIAPLNS